MTQADVIGMLGRRLGDLDVLRGSFDKDSPERKALDVQRDELSGRREILTKKYFKESAKSYKKITREISKIDGDLQGVIREVAKVGETLKTLAQLMTAVDELIKIAAEAMV